MPLLPCPDVYFSSPTYSFKSRTSLTVSQGYW